MKPISWLLALFALPLAVFGYWGLYTATGRRHYDEMAGMYPAIALLVSGILLLSVILIQLLAFIKSRRRRS